MSERLEIGDGNQVAGSYVGPKKGIRRAKRETPAQQEMSGPAEKEVWWVKPGYITTEFWMSALPMVVIGVLLALGRVDIKEVGELWPIFATPAGYAISRAIAKK